MSAEASDPAQAPTPGQEPLIFLSAQVSEAAAIINGHTAHHLRAMGFDPTNPEDARKAEYMFALGHAAARAEQLAATQAAAQLAGFAAIHRETAPGVPAFPDVDERAALGADAARELPLLPIVLDPFEEPAPEAAAPSGEPYPVLPPEPPAPAGIYHHEKKEKKPGKAELPEFDEWFEQIVKDTAVSVQYFSEDGVVKNVSNENGKNLAERQEEENLYLLADLGVSRDFLREESLRGGTHDVIAMTLARKPKRIGQGPEIGFTDYTGLDDETKKGQTPEPLVVVQYMVAGEFAEPTPEGKHAGNQEVYAEVALPLADAMTLKYLMEDENYVPQDPRMLQDLVTQLLGETWEAKDPEHAEQLIERIRNLGKEADKAGTLTFITNIDEFAKDAEGRRNSVPGHRTYMRTIALPERKKEA